MDLYNNFMGLPAGFGLALTANERAMNSYSRMTEAEKERIIMQCKDAKSDREMEKIIDSIPSDEMPDELTTETRDRFY